MHKKTKLWIGKFEAFIWFLWVVSVLRAASMLPVEPGETAQLW
jgi:hypothetical protein